MNYSDGFRSAEEKERYIQSTFSSIAGHYDAMNQWMTFYLDRRWRKKTALISAVPIKGRALDVCCGTGELSHCLAEQVSLQGEVTALDFNEDMLAVARKKQQKNRIHGNITFLQGNAMELPFDDNSFDTATIGFGLRNVPDFRQVLGEMMRVIRPGGTVVSLETAKPDAFIIKDMHKLYVKQLVPLLDKLSGGPKGPYAWLARSAQSFLPQEELAQEFRALGLEKVRYHNLLGGAVAIHVGFKR
ncbi:demethylmenaquinone methyltransferase [Heliorestis acidaminivorans]|uniref:Demethylmenaquinone methyltransferase n=1 Tax=Heliorestis acidaminivorans TaxID=553427 RepID=A0A6I0EXS9_9FIRM|nr:demethylmenaquinone methyltransferase [Heliorestis acidaminivorans]KAB2954609.1 demethylmenaquinone methyltransferase [Heliorestis acidaminivorans]